MSPDGLLRQHTQNLIDRRDEALEGVTEARTVADSTRYAAMAEAFSTALRDLHNLSDGVFGHVAEDQDEDDRGEDYWSPEPVSQASAEFMARQGVSR